MPSTPTYDLPYPVATDSADVPRDVQALAEASEDALSSLAIQIPAATAPAVRVSPASAIAIPNDTNWHSVDFSGGFDQGQGSWTPTITSGVRVVPGIAGWWLWAVIVGFDTSPSNTLLVMRKPAGAALGAVTTGGTQNLAKVHAELADANSASGLIHLDATDGIEVMVSQQTGVSGLHLTLSTSNNPTALYLAQAI